MAKEPAWNETEAEVLAHALGGLSHAGIAGASVWSKHGMRRIYLEFGARAREHYGLMPGAKVWADLRRRVPELGARGLAEGRRDPFIAHIAPVVVNLAADLRSGTDWRPSLLAARAFSGLRAGCGGEAAREWAHRAFARARGEGAGGEMLVWISECADQIWASEEDPRYLQRWA